MALQKIISAHSDELLTEELPGGKWAHTPLYFKYRYGDTKQRTPKQHSESNAERMLREAVAKLTPAERTLLLAQLDTEED